MNRLAVDCCRFILSFVLIERRINGLTPNEATFREEGKVQMLTHQYQFRSDTVLHELKNGANSPTTVAVHAKYTFDMLHYDRTGGVLGRYKLSECLSDACHNCPDVYVAFVQGGNNLRELFLAQSEQSQSVVTWNLLLAVINTVYTPASGASDLPQTVMTPYGTCLSQFSRPENKVFKRRISDCNLQPVLNHSLIPLLTYHNYEQVVVYKQNLKIDADITEINAIETLEIGSDLDKKWTVFVRTVSTAKLLKRKAIIVDRYCDQNETAKECAETRLKLKSLGTNWSQIMRRLTATSRPSHISHSFADLVKQYRERLQSMGGSQASDEQSLLLFANLVNSVCHHIPDIDTIETVLKMPENDIVLPSMADVLATCANKREMHNFAKQFFANESTELLERYIRALSLGTTTDDHLIDDLMEWFKMDESDIVEIKIGLSLTLATLLRRRFSEVNSEKEGNSDPDFQKVREFINFVTDCDRKKADVVDCQQMALSALKNLKSPICLPYVSDYLCLKSSKNSHLHLNALKVIGEIPPRHFHKTLLNKLVRTFRNTCPLAVDMSGQILAGQILVNVARDRHQKHNSDTILSALLRSVDGQKRAPYEKWAYFYALIEQLKNEDIAFKEQWNRLRKLRPFRPNYAQKAVPRDVFSSVFRGTFLDIERKVTFGIGAMFSNGLFRDSLFDVRVDTTNDSAFSLMTLSLHAEGLENFIGSTTGDDRDETCSSGNTDSEAVANEVITSEEESHLEPSASMELAFFGSTVREVSLFRGQTQLVSNVWNYADGQTLTVYQANVITRLYSTEIPQLNGLSLYVNIIGAASISLVGSIDISIWYRTSSSNLLTNASFALFSARKLLSSDGRELAHMEKTFSAVTSVDFETEVDFYDRPFKMCMKMRHGPLQIGHKLSKGKKKRTWKRQIEAATFSAHPKVQRMCNQLKNHWDSQ